MKSALPVILGFLLFTMCSCNRGENKSTQFDFLNGQWLQQESQGTYSENWQKLNDTLYQAFCFTNVPPNYVDSEKVQLSLRKDGIYYSALVFNQNGGKSVDFKLVDTSGQRYIFENKQHDFPQQIVYHLKRPDTLFVYIEGPDSLGIRRRIDFSMIRQKTGK